jgi:hypothetical protein
MQDEKKVKKPKKPRELKKNKKDKIEVKVSEKEIELNNNNKILNEVINNNNNDKLKDVEINNKLKDVEINNKLKDVELNNNIDIDKKWIAKRLLTLEQHELYQIYLFLVNDNIPFTKSIKKISVNSTDIPIDTLVKIHEYIKRCINDNNKYRQIEQNF